MTDRRSLSLLLLSLGVCVVAACGDDEVMLDGSLDGAVDSGVRPDGGTCIEDPTAFPAPVAGRCEANTIDPNATLPVGDDGMGGFITPGARRTTRIGGVVEVGGFPMRVIEVPGTRFVLVTDGGIGDESLSVVDLDALTIVDQEIFRRGAPTPEALFLGLAVSSDGRRVWASGGGANTVWGFDLDPATGALARAPTRDLVVAMSRADGYVSGIALTSDDATLVVNVMFAHEVAIFDAATSTERARIALEPGTMPFDVILTQDDAVAWVSGWAGQAVVPIDLATRTAGMPVPVGKNPEGLALSPDGTRLVVASSDSDSFAVLDVASGMVLDTIYVDGETAPRGSSPAAGAFDAAGRLYVVNAGDNAVDVFDPAGMGFTRVGRIPTMWYPTDVRVLSDGTVLILNGKHMGTGPNDTPGTTDILDLLGGSMTVLAPGEITDTLLSDWEMEIDANNTRATRFSEVTCPDGAPYDFPIPAEGAGPSSVIEHVVVVVRENKTYDAYLGDLDLAGAPHGNGDPALTLIPTADIEQVIPNTRALARTFTVADNYYSGAEQSVQGHIWTTHDRTTDFTERSWLTTWGRAFWGIPPQGVADPLGYPEEGSIFDYFEANGIDASNFGEIVAARANAPNARYPGIVYNMAIPDIDKANWLHDEWRLRCRLTSFTYIVMPNDHTYGRDPGRPTPRAMMADNDEGVGRLVDALSHSTYWPSTAVFVIWDDPQDGGDHVDNHRSPALVISPWAKRGHVTSVSYNESSVYRTIQLILGVDAPLNAYWANASPMLDAFTSTPDYTPYEHTPRQWPAENNPADGSSMAAQSQRYDWSAPDQQPGLSRMLWRHLRESEPPWPILPEVVLEGIEEAQEDADGDLDEGG